MATILMRKHKHGQQSQQQHHHPQQQSHQQQSWLARRICILLLAAVALLTHGSQFRQAPSDDSAKQNQPQQRMKQRRNPIANPKRPQPEQQGQQESNQPPPTNAKINQLHERQQRQRERIIAKLREKQEQQKEQRAAKNNNNNKKKKNQLQPPTKVGIPPDWPSWEQFYGNNDDTIPKFQVLPDDPEYTGTALPSPIVLRQYKLVFFGLPKVGSTAWKMMLRRLAGQADWASQQHGLPHNPKRHGLTLLRHLSLREANHVMTAPEWVRAIFVRDPLERFLSAYLDRGRDVSFLETKCCVLDPKATTTMAINNHPKPKVSSLAIRQQQQLLHAKNDCVQTALASPQGFLQVLQQYPTTCGHDPHLRPQSQRMTYKYWRQINFIGRANQADARSLFQRLGIWDLPEIQSGWGPLGTERFLSPEATLGRSHGKGAKGRQGKLMDQALQAALLEHYREDYRHAILNFTRPTKITR